MIDPALFAELRDLCLRSFPERLDQRLFQIAAIDTGRHPALVFSLSWQEGVRLRVERLLLQRYADQWTWWRAQDREKIQREWTVLRWLYGIGLPVPRPYACSVQDADSFLLVEYPAAGQSTTPNSNGRSAMARQQHIDAFGTVLARLHCQSIPDSVRDALPRIEVREQLEQMTRIAQQREDTALIEAIRDLSQIEVTEYPPCVLHGDPQLASFQYDARGITAWLDWENSAIGDPRWDVACVINELQISQRPSWANRFCEAYAGRASAQLHDMVYWQALAALQRWTMTRQVHSTLSLEDKSLSLVQLEQLKKQAWTVLAHLRDARAAASQPEN